MNIGSLFSRHARYRPNHLSVVFEDQRLTWLEFNQSINRLANFLLKMGIQKGDKVATLLPNCLDMIISGGVNVYPRDIEEIVAQHPAVQEVAVYGIPHEKWGETPLAAVILQQPGSVTAEELRAWINERVGAKFQRVHDVVILEDFPRSVAGKTLKRVMREPYWEGQERRF